MPPDPYGVHRALRRGSLPLAVSLAVLAALAVQAWAWVELRDVQHRGRRSLATIAEISLHVDAAVMGANDFVSTRAESDRILAHEGLAAARASLAALGGVTFGLDPDIDRVTQALEALAARTDRIWFGADFDARVAAMRHFDAGIEPVKAALWALTTAVKDGLERTLVRAVIVLSGGLTGALGLVVLVFVAASRRTGRARAEGEAGLAREMAHLGEYLHAVAAGTPAPDPPAGRFLEPVAAAAQRAAAAVTSARTTLERERTHTRFSHSLMSALELARSEEDVDTIVRHAAASATPGAGIQFLVADNSRTILRPRLGDLDCACDPPSPFDCPALRGGWLLRHEPGVHLGRCLKLRTPSSEVACAAVTIRGEAAGVLQMVGRLPTDDEEDMLHTLSLAVGARLGIVRTLAERELQAAHDGLTGLANRRAMLERLRSLDRSGETYAIVFADLDHFKRLNDTYGHEAGDRALRVFAQVLRENARRQDLACRPGGEEFVLLLHAADAEQALQVAGRVRGRLRDVGAAAGVAFTVSMGVAAKAGPMESFDSVVRAADQALYAAKRLGRDRAIAWDPGMSRGQDATGPGSGPVAWAADEPGADGDTPRA